MKGRTRRLARWFQLGLTCLTLAVTGAPAYARPGTYGAVAASVERRDPSSGPRQSRFRPAHIGDSARNFAPLRPQAQCARCLSSDATPRATSRLYMKNRALLR